MSLIEVSYAKSKRLVGEAPTLGKLNFKRNGGSEKSLSDLFCRIARMAIGWHRVFHHGHNNGPGFEVVVVPER